MIGWTIIALWLAFALYWAESSTDANAPVTTAATPWFLLPLLLCDALLILPVSTPVVAAFPITGLLMTATGLLYAAWARDTLGKNWAGDITIQQHHELVRHGAYRQHRHPIYVGVFLAFVGVGLYIGELHAYIAPLLGLLAFIMKARQEENQLTEIFPDYEIYKAGTYW